MHSVDMINVASCLIAFAVLVWPSDTAISLFSQTGIMQRLPCKVKGLLSVPVTPKDCVPEHTCCKCKRKLERLERVSLKTSERRRATRCQLSL